MEPEKKADQKSKWDRSWTYARSMVKMKEGPPREEWPEVSLTEQQKYALSKKAGWRSFLFELATPISIVPSLDKIIFTEKLRVYPPFNISKKTPFFYDHDKVEIPVGESQITSKIKMPKYGTGHIRSNVHKGSITCYGLRMDAADGVSIERSLSLFLRLIRQYSMQWWVASRTDPFDPGLRSTFEVNSDFTPREALFVRGAKFVASPWNPMAATQRKLGLERPVDAALWKSVGECMVFGGGVEDALQYYLDGIAAYMDYDDPQCIMNLALMFEVAENKVRALTGKPQLSANKDLLQSPTITSSESVSVFRKMITDRDNVAHGKKPYHLSREPKLIFEYLENGSDLMQRYLTKCVDIGWEKAATLSL